MTAVTDRAADRAPPDRIGSPAPSPMVWGLRKRLAKARLWSRIGWLALRAYGNPIRALRAVRELSSERDRWQKQAIVKYAHASGRWFWNFYSPGFPSPAFDRFVRNELDRIMPFRRSHPALQSVVFGITKRCALRCKHCCEWDVLNSRESLSRDELLDVARHARDEGASQLLLSGGEPLRRFGDAVAVIEAVSADVDVWLLSSGHGLTAERATTLRAAGLTGVALSLDHWDAAEHDCFRGFDGAYEWVERGAENARAAGLLVAVSLCPIRAFVSPRNLDLYSAAARRLGASFIQILEPKAVGHFNGLDVMLSPDQQRVLEEFADRLNSDPASRELPAVSYVDYTGRTGGCRGAGDRYLYIDPEGLMHACPFCRSPAGSALEFDDTLTTLRAAGCRAKAGYRSNG